MGWRRLGTILADPVLSWNWSISRKVHDETAWLWRDWQRWDVIHSVDASFCGAGQIGLGGHAIAALPAQAQLEAFPGALRLRLG